MDRKEFFVKRWRIDNVRVQGEEWCGMCQFMMFLAMMCCATLGVCAVEYEESAKVVVYVNTSNDNRFLTCGSEWDITHVKSENTDPLWKRLVNLEQNQAFGQPFLSKMLDDAMQSLVKDIERDDEKGEPSKRLKEGLDYLSQRNGWYWHMDSADNYRLQPLIPGAVRLSLERIPGVSERGQSPVIEGFSARNGCRMEPRWWGGVAYLLCDAMD